MFHLPTPDEAALHHSQRLQNLILNRIHQQEGLMSFSSYMEQTLYEPGLGYYSSGNQKFGASGDFITAPELSPLFSKCLARACHSILYPMQGKGSILELGAGSGQMAVDLLTELTHLNSPPHDYFILEVSAELQERQQNHIKQTCPEWLAKIHWLDSLPNSGFQGVIVANEVCDAMPVHCFCIQHDSILEGCVREKENHLAWTWVPAPTYLAEAIETRLRTLSDSMSLSHSYITEILEQSNECYYSEINLNIAPWMKSISHSLDKGTIIIVDYGFPRQEYYHPSRDKGTLMCHYRHHAHTNPFLYPGLQDITAHVDFTELAEAATDNHLHLSGFTNQASFLLENGILDMAQQSQGKSTPFNSRNIHSAPELTEKMAFERQRTPSSSLDNPINFYAQNRDIQLLTSPNAMGELFKVIAFSKNIHHTIQGFSFNNLIYRL